jgi:hypothetical protein
VGVTTHQGERESRSQGQGAQVLKIDNDGEVREMRNAATVLAITHYEHWRAGCPESGHVRFGGGPSEKDPISGTSPAAYPTVRRVRRGATRKRS